MAKSLRDDRWLARIGVRVRAARNKLGLSQLDLGQRVGRSKQSVSFWETGTWPPNLSDLVSLAEVLNVSTDFIIFGIDGARCPYPTMQELIELADGNLEVDEIGRTYPLFRPIKNAVRIDIFDHAMMPRFDPTTTSILLDREKVPAPGDLCLIVLLSTREALFRKIRPTTEDQPNRPPYTLIATNKDFRPRLITAAQRPKFMGVLVEISDTVGQTAKRR
jgi:transcriptional regulator with XRE-family HTH domain